MKKYAITIPTPCTASIEEMTPNANGHFCQSCQKQVVDFTGMTDQQMIAYFKKHGNVCGSFLPSQINREIALKSNNTWMPAALLVGMLAIIPPTTGKAQQKITGIVYDSTNRKPIPAAKITMTHHNGHLKKTQTKANGSFKLLLPDKDLEAVHLQLNSKGYDTVNLAVNLKNLEVKSQSVPVTITFGGAIMIAEESISILGTGDTWRPAPWGLWNSF